MYVIVFQLQVAMGDPKILYYQIYSQLSSNQSSQSLSLLMLYCFLDRANEKNINLSNL